MHEHLDTTPSEAVAPAVGPVAYEAPAIESSEPIVGHLGNKLS